LKAKKVQVDHGYCKAVDNPTSQSIGGGDGGGGSFPLPQPILVRKIEIL